MSDQPVEIIQSEILTIEDAAYLLRIPVSTAYKLAQQGKIPGRKVGRHWRFHRETLINWIAGISTPHQDPAKMASLQTP